jgi:2-oxoisovalerate dehydrogenase E1 component
MQRSRAIDRIEDELITRGEAIFHVPCAGHEGIAVLEEFLIPADWLHLHYRDRALMLARGVEPAAFLHGLLATVESSSAGRQMAPFMSEPSLRILSQVTPVGNHALQAVGMASVVKEDPGQPIVVCTLGDGTTQQGEVLEAIAETVRSQLPVLFVIEDNGYSISTRTRHRTFYSRRGEPGLADRFYGQVIERVNGRDVVRAREPIRAVIESVRRRRGPAIVVFEVDRLGSHTSSDDQRVYRSVEELELAHLQGDPIRILGDHLLDRGVAQTALDEIGAEALAEARQAAEGALRAADPDPEFGAKRDLPPELLPGAEEYGGTADGTPRLTMLEAIREVLRSRLAANPRVILLGEDIEDPKGDVFGLTRGLSRAFPGRVVNSPLSEATIVGSAIGQALAGLRPVAFLQFADFLPLVFNQILCELGSMYWRSNGGWECPVILMVACGGYRPGLGPFHAQTLEAMLAHVPGVDVFMPSQASDAAGLLNAAFASGRPTVFLYPKALLNDRERTTSSDVPRQLVPIARSRRLRCGDDLTLVAWGNTVLLCEQVADTLASIGQTVDLFDLRSISPWDSSSICASARRTQRLIVAHEDNMTCGFGAEIIATVAESAGVQVECRRVARPDTFVPFNFANQLEVLPSFRRILAAAADLLHLELSWQRPAGVEDGLLTIEAFGPSPADQSIRVISWDIATGDQVSLGQHLAELEADKAVFDLRATAAGRIEAVLVPEGKTVRFGTPLLRIAPDDSVVRSRRREKEDHPTPLLRHKSTFRSQEFLPRRDPSNSAPVASLSMVSVVEGSELVTNDHLAASFAGRSASEILLLTGIESRRRLAPGESALSMAVAAARQALSRADLTIDAFDALICSTSTPLAVTPSMACLILNELCRGGPAGDVPAYDIAAACSGYLYALSAGFDWTRSRPEARVLIVTAEAMSQVVDPADFDTGILFGDAATATILSGPEVADFGWARFRRPVLSAKGEDGRALSLGSGRGDRLRMDGRKVFPEAVRQLVTMLERACNEAGLRASDLDLIVPHQANSRILDAVRHRLGLPTDTVFNNLRYRGNTSSSTIPIALADIANRCRPGDKVGLTSFGGGFTSAAAILEISGAP